MKYFSSALALSAAFLMCGCAGTDGAAGGAIALKQEVFEVNAGEPFSLDPAVYLDGPSDALEETKLSSKSLKDRYGSVVNARKELVIMGETAYVEAGSYQFTARYKDQTLAFRVDVKDLEAPVIHHFQSAVTVSGSTDAIDWNTFIQAEDVSDFEFVQKGDIQFGTEGMYPVSVQAVDSFGNESEPVSIVVTVSDTLAPDTIATETTETGSQDSTPENPLESSQVDREMLLAADTSSWPVKPALNRDQSGWDDNGDGTIDSDEYISHCEVYDVPSVDDKGIPNDFRIKFDDVNDAMDFGDKYSDARWSWWNLRYDTENGKPVYWLYLTRASR